VLPGLKQVADVRTDQLRGLGITLGLCFLAALFEGLDIVAPGLVAPRLVPAFALSPSAAGWLFSSSTIGLLIGAVFGGWVADRIGRKRVLVASMLVFGVMSLVTVLSTDAPMLFASRFVTGLGLGGAMPNLIALCAEAGPVSRRATFVTLPYSGVPLGGALGSSVVLWGGAMDNWRILFIVGGIGPLVVGVLLALLLPESGRFRRSRAGGLPKASRVAHTLFGDANAVTTVLLWGTFFSTLLILYLLINWLPLLLVRTGYSRPDAALTSIIFNVGGGVGAIVLGWLADRQPQSRVILATYLCMAGSLLGLSLTFQYSGVHLGVMAAAGFAVGFFVIGAQLALYGVAPGFYPTPVRATGLGAAVAAGRMGSIVGPILAGQMIGSGSRAATVVTMLLPIVAVAGAGAVVLVLRPMLGDEREIAH
jgi:AAHS family 3-hydroxyphenylpropionic acid transporter